MRTIVKIRFITGILLLLTAVPVWVWLVWPVTYTERIVSLPSLSFPDTQMSGFLDRINQHELQVKLVYPVKMHTGEYANFLVQVIGRQDLPVENIQPFDVQMMAEGRLVVPLVYLDPPDSIRCTFSPEKLPGFSWKIKSGTENNFSGQFWFYLLFVKPDGMQEKQTLLSLPIKLEVRDFFGLPENHLIWLVGIITLAGLIIFPFFEFFRRQTNLKD